MAKRKKLLNEAKIIIKRFANLKEDKNFLLALRNGKIKKPLHQKKLDRMKELVKKIEARERAK
jgi:hypothetical protein